MKHTIVLTFNVINDRPSTYVFDKAQLQGVTLDDLKLIHNVYMNVDSMTDEGIRIFDIMNDALCEESQYCSDSTHPMATKLYQYLQAEDETITTHEQTTFIMIGGFF